MSNKKNLLKNTAIGLIPEDWDISEVNQLGNIVTGTTPKTTVPEYYNEDYMFISPGDINNNKYVKKTQKYLSEKGLTVSRILPKNTVLVVCIGATIGKVAMTEAEISTTNQQINAVIPNQKVNADYLYYAFKYRSPYLPTLAGRAAVPILNKSNFGRFLIPLPPLPEQKSIAHTLRTIQKAKETRQSELELERERKAALMEYLFTHGTRNEARKQTEIGEIPESWDIYKLRNICIKQPQNGAFIKKPQWGKGTLFVNVVDTYRSAIVNFNYVERLICTEEDISRFSLQNGDLLFVRSSLKREGIAQCCLIESLHEPAIFDCHLIRVIPDQSISDNYYLTCYFLSERARNDLIARSKMTTMTTINQNNLIDSLVPIPSLPEQKEIANILKSCDRKIQALEKEISLTDELFHATLEELMTGKLSTKNLIAQ